MALYGDPTASPVPVSTENRRPDCWGKNYLEGDLECRQCLYNTSCKEKIVSLNIARPVGVPVTKPEPTPVSSQTYYLPWSKPQPVFTSPAPQPQQYVLQQPWRATSPENQPQSPPKDTYGWAQDPMFTPVATAPTPYRPQMKGESFSERIVKNMFLSALEAVAAQAFLAIRQMVLPPGDD